MSQSVLHAFTSTAAHYDQDRSRLIPGFADIYGTAVDLVPSGAQQILDLGAGTGLLASLIRSRFPKAHLHLVDLSAAMLAKAQERFHGDTQVSFEVADYACAPLAWGYDAIVSALSIHHLEHASKQQLFRKILSALRPGGVFLNAEQVLGPTVTLESRYKADWLAEVQALGATPQQIAESMIRQQQDRCATVEQQLQWMREAGLVDVDCHFKRGRFATLLGSKASSSSVAEPRP